MLTPVVAGVEVAHSLFQIQSRHRQSGNIIKHFFLDTNAAAKKSSSFFCYVFLGLANVCEWQRTVPQSCTQTLVQPEKMCLGKTQ